MAALLRDKAQWLVPSDRVILLCRLYLPAGLSMGMRLTSLKVAASKTISAPPSALRSHRLAAGAYWSRRWGRPTWPGLEPTDVPGVGRSRLGDGQVVKQQGDPPLHGNVGWRPFARRGAARPDLVDDRRERRRFFHHPFFFDRRRDDRLDADAQTLRSRSAPARQQRGDRAQRRIALQQIIDLARRQIEFGGRSRGQGLPRTRSV